MPTTFEQHHAALSRIQPDAPHPDSYRPDLPLRSELFGRTPEEEAAFDAGKEQGIEEGRDDVREERYDEGFDDGKEEGRRLEAARVRELERENATLREKLEKTA